MERTGAVVDFVVDDHVEIFLWGEVSTWVCIVGELFI